MLYRTTSLFLKLFGMTSLDDLPDIEEWDPSPEEEADLRERLLRAGEARAGATPPTQGSVEDEAPERPIEGDGADPAAAGLTPVADAEAEEAEAEVVFDDEPLADDDEDDDPEPE